MWRGATLGAGLLAAILAAPTHAAQIRCPSGHIYSSPATGVSTDTMYFGEARAVVFEVVADNIFIATIEQCCTGPCVTTDNVGWGVAVALADLTGGIPQVGKLTAPPQCIYRFNLGACVGCTAADAWFRCTPEGG